MNKKIIFTKNAPLPIGPYSQAVQVGNLVYLSGQIAINSETNELNIADLKTETKQVMKNINALLNEAGSSFSEIIKTSIFLSNMELFAEVNEIYASYFTENFPARETVAVLGLPKNVNVEISCVALVK
ncbi:MAG: RidA family protein [Chitinophagaceae bacterium]|nr:RidA family protein [Chitinophagaceae bacterium]